MANVAVPSFVPATSVAPNHLPNASVADPIWRGILLVEPDISLLTAETLLLNNSNYCVTPALSHGEIIILRDTKAVALAILSTRLGHSLLGAVAETVRRQWPLARILILGRAESILDDHLYDEQVYHSSDPRQLLDDIERLYRGSWNQRSNTLDWNAGRSALCVIRPPISESDPTKVVSRGTTQGTSHRDSPSGIRYRQR